MVDDDATPTGHRRGEPEGGREVRLVIDTTGRSLLHGLAARTRPHIFLSWVAISLLTYGAMAMGALLGSASPLAISTGLRLPFFLDYNTAFLFLASFPILLVLLISDDAALRHSLGTVQRHGVLEVDEGAADRLKRRWTDVFLKTNQTAQVVGLCIGIGITWESYETYKDVGHWIVQGQSLTLAGWAWIWSMVAFWSVLPLFIARVVATIFFLRELVAHSQIRMLPAHPDHCGGLRPVGDLGLRYQVLLTFMGINVLLMAGVTATYLTPRGDLLWLIAAAAVAYLTLGPLVFVGPLLPFREGMLLRKSELMQEIALRLRYELGRIRAKIPPPPNDAGDLTGDDEELIDRLRKVGSIIEEMPVWPFDASTLRRFVAAYILPVAAALGYPLLSMVVESIRARVG